MRFTILGSGSRGNAILAQNTRGGSPRSGSLLIDCGFGARALMRRLAARGARREDIAAVALSHEHADHARVDALCALTAPVFATAGVAAALDLQKRLGARLRIIAAGRMFAVAGFSLTPVAVRHDSAAPVMFVVSNGERKLGVLTDLGEADRAVADAFSGMHALVLEANYDEEMLAANKKYPEKIKERIRGARGHLSNAAAAALLRRLCAPPMHTAVAAHLSQHNNTPELARAALAAACPPQVEVAVAGQKEGLDWRSV